METCTDTEAPPEGPGGTTAVSTVDEMAWNEVTTEPNVTLVAPLNPVPSRVTRPPPVVGPLAGVTEVTSGEVKVNREPATTGWCPPPSRWW